jgi:hypothetical protein
MSVVLFMLGYGRDDPSVLYSGSVAVLLLFDIPGLTESIISPLLAAATV